MKVITTILGYSALISGLLLLLQNSFLSGTLEVSLGQWKCGNRYMQPVNGVVGDVSCGFNMDAAISAAAIALLLIGLALIVSSTIRATAHKG